MNRIQQLNKYKKTLIELQKIPEIPQRTNDWYNTRNSLITASDFGQALNCRKFGSQKEFIIKKVEAYSYTDTQRKIELSKYTNNSNPAMQWGIKYEEVAMNIYADRNNLKMFEFGLIKHPSISFIGASPDAISELGIMLEIKCPYKRKITGEVPEQYYYQIQGQLEVCDLDECDYLECNIKQYKTEDEFINDIPNDNIVNTLHLTHNYNEKGIIIQYRNSDDDPLKYLYSPHNISPQDAIKWKNEIITNFDVFTYFNVDYWYLVEYHCKRILRDRDFFNSILLNLNFLWEKINYFRKNNAIFQKNIVNSKKRKIIYDFSYNNIYIHDDININGFAIQNNNE